jgi:hypothetical protein
MEDIGNILGSYIKTYFERATKRLYTYGFPCVEINLSKGILNKMILKYNFFI